MGVTPKNQKVRGRRKAGIQHLKTCGEILDAYAKLPPPNVEVADIESYLASRGRRSRRPRL